MNAASIPAIVMTGIACTIGMRHVSAYVRLREHKEYLAFATTCLFVAVYTTATAGLYSVTTPEEGMYWQRAQVSAAIFSALAFLWFIYWYTGQMSAFARNTFSIYYAISALVLWFDQSGLSWAGQRPSVKEIDLPLGIEVVYYEVAPGPLVEITIGIGLVFLAYVLWCCLRFYRVGQKAKARVLLWAISLFVFGVVNDMAVTVGAYEFVYLIEYAYIGMILLIDHSLSRVMLEAARMRHGHAADENRYRRMFQHAEDIYFEATPEGRILDISPSVERITGFPREHIVGRMADEFYMDPEQREALRRRIRETGRVDDFDIRMRLTKGREADFALSAAIVIGEEGTPPRVIGSMRDVTRRRKAENTAERAAVLNARLRNLAKKLEEAPSLSAGFNLALQTALKMSGWQTGAAYAIEKGKPTLQTRQNLPFTAAKALEKLPVEDEDMRRTLMAGGPAPLGSLPWDFLAEPELRPYQSAYVTPCICQNTIVGFFVLAPSNDRDKRETVDAAAAVAADTAGFIARQLETEEARRREEQYWRTQEFAQVGSWEYDVVRETLTGSQETGRIFGLAKSIREISLPVLSKIFHPADRDRILGTLNHFVNGELEAYNVEYRIIRENDGEVRTVHSVAQLVEDDAGRITRVLGTVQDITKQKQLQEQLFLAQRMESVGLLAGGIAHDFNNLLSVILSCSDLALAGLGSEDPKYPIIHEIRQAGERARHVTQQLLAFSKRQVMEMRVLDLNALFRDMTPMFERLLGEGVELRIELDANLRSVEADPTQIEQIMMNFAANARDAMQSEGVLTIVTENISVSAPPSDTGQLPLKPGDYSTITVSDNGPGMSSDVLERVFDPFFTTKSAEQGVGLGLATVYGIVKQHQGYIRAESKPGQGARFRVYLPSVAGPPEELPKTSALGGEMRGSETILVVEDEEMVRELTSNVLRRYGYDVMAAEDGVAALDLAEHCERRIDLLLTDVVMPRMNGRDLYERLAPQIPDMKVLFMSGYANELVEDCCNPDSDAMLHKPFTVQSLTEKVRSILDA